MEGQEKFEYILYILVRDYFRGPKRFFGDLWFGGLDRSDVGSVSVDTAFGSMSMIPLMIVSSRDRAKGCSQDTTRVTVNNPTAVFRHDLPRLSAFHGVVGANHKGCENSRVSSGALKFLSQDTCYIE